MKKQDYKLMRKVRNYQAARAVQLMKARIHWEQIDANSQINAKETGIVP